MNNNPIDEAEKQRRLQELKAKIGELSEIINGYHEMRARRPSWFFASKVRLAAPSQQLSPLQTPKAAIPEEVDKIDSPELK